MTGMTTRLSAYRAEQIISNNTGHVTTPRIILYNLYNIHEHIK